MRVFFRRKDIDRRSGIMFFIVKASSNGPQLMKKLEWA
jgi:hypothetical protein